MAITPAYGYIADPNNPNGVIRDPAIATPPGGASPTAPAPVTAPTTATTPAAPTSPTTPAAPTTGTSGPAAPTSPEDQKLLSLGVTPEQLNALNNPQGLDPASFQALVGNIETKLKTNNDLVTQRGYLIKHLYDSPLTPEELAKLPPDLQQVVGQGKDATELQIRLLNDQIAGRANTLTQSIGYLTNGYQTAVQQQTDQRNAAIANVQNFVSQYGSQAPAALKALYGQSYLDQLKAEGIDIAAFSKVAPETISQQRYVPVTSGSGLGYNLSSYASDPNYTTEIGNIVKSIGTVSTAADAQSYISSTNPNSPITGSMVVNSANQYGVDPAILMAQLQQESQFGTSNVATADNNPSGVTWSQAYQDAHPGTSKGTARPEGGNYVKFASMQDGINANAEWLSQHQAPAVDPTVQAYVTGIQNGTITSLAQVPTQYKNVVAQAMADQGISTPLSDRRFVMAANGIIANYISLPEYTLTANALPYLLKLDAAMTIPGSVSDQELLDSFTKLSTAGGVITDAQVSVITGGRSLADSVDVYKKKLAQGGVLSDAQRQQIYELGQASYKNLKAGYQPIYDKATQQLQQSQIPSQYWTLPDLNTLSALSEAAVNAGNTTSSPTSTSGGGSYQDYLSAIGQ
ncbi:MAG: glucosaminidase domain-containing protein [Patescibacteria group bacterium]